MQLPMSAAFSTTVMLPSDPEQLVLLGAGHLQQGQLSQAQLCIDRVLVLRPHLPRAHYLRGVLMRQLGRPLDALADFQRTTQLDPRYAEAYYNQGVLLQEMRRLDEALASYDRALALNPQIAEAYNNRGTVLRLCGRLEEALHAYDCALALKPDAQTYNNRSVALRFLWRTREAIADCERALALQPRCVDAYINRGIVFQDLGRLQEALEDYERAMALRPEDPEPRFYASMVKLLSGDLPQGWQLYENRHARQPKRAFRQPQWSGQEELAGKRILLHGEQGFGDTIQFCRYVPLVAQRGGSVILEVPAPLARLLATLPGVERCAIRGDPLPNFDYHCPLLSLPLAFNTTLSSIPADVPYLRSDPREVRQWRARLGETRKRRVGLVWSGGHRPDHPELWCINDRRNIPLRTLSALRRPGLEFYSLQKGQPAESELTAVTAGGWDGPEIHDFSALLRDFADSAALIEQLDLVISVDTATAHLAGALGKPVWILNRFDTCWRWLLDRPDTPWYPTAQLYRQPRGGDWDSVIAEVARDLARKAQEAR